MHGFDRDASVRAEAVNQFRTRECCFESSQPVSSLPWELARITFVLHALEDRALKNNAVAEIVRALNWPCEVLVWFPVAPHSREGVSGSEPPVNMKMLMREVHEFGVLMHGTDDRKPSYEAMPLSDPHSWHLIELANDHGFSEEHELCC